jgi:hypothetical protein
MNVNVWSITTTGAQEVRFFAIEVDEVVSVERRS